MADNNTNNTNNTTTPTNTNSNTTTPTNTNSNNNNNNYNTNYNNNTTNINQDLTALLNKWDQMYRAELTNIALSRFSWKGLPRSIPGAAIEPMLIDYGSAAAFEYYGQLVIQPGFTTNIDIYARPRTFYVQPYFSDMLQGLPPLKNGITCEIIQDAPLSMTGSGTGAGVGGTGLGTSGFSGFYSYTRSVIIYYALKMAELKMKEWVSIRKITMPIIFTGNRKDRASMDRLAQYTDSGQPFVVMVTNNPDFSLNTDFSQAASDFHGQDLELMLQQTRDEALRALGVRTTPTEKRERLTDEESTVTMDLSDGFLEPLLEQRQQAAKEINDHFGTHISVESASGQLTGDGQLTNSLPQVPTSPNKVTGAPSLTNKKEDDNQ